MNAHPTASGQEEQERAQPKSANLIPRHFDGGYSCRSRLNVTEAANSRKAGVTRVVLPPSAAMWGARR
jgi:hypothetical protein